jgi:hypothetical protein
VTDTNNAFNGVSVNAFTTLCDLKSSIPDTPIWTN